MQHPRRSRGSSLLLALAIAATACSSSKPSASPGGSGGGPGGGPIGGEGPGGDAAPAVDATSPGAPSGTSDGGTAAPDVVVPPLGDASIPPSGPEQPLPPCLRTVNVTDSTSLATALGAARAGDCIVLADGDYTFPSITAKGTADQPIVVKAANTLKAVVSTGNLAISGSAYVVVTGLTWSGSGTITMTDCDHCRVSRFRIQRKETGGDEWTQITGTSSYCRIDHNDFGPQNQVGNMVQIGGVGGGQVSQYNRIDHNFFHDVHFNGGNGWETIRDGLSGWAYSSAHTLIEHNLFKNDHNDPEIISVKSSDNVIRRNTFRASNGHLSQRHGNRNEIYGNYVLGDGVGGSAGIRICGGDHKIYNNYIEGVADFGILLEGGENDDAHGANTDHKQVYNAVVAFNTIVSKSGIVLGGMHPLEPINSVVAYNIVQGAADPLTQAGGTKGTKWIGNVVNGGAVGPAGAGAMAMDPKLVKVGEVFEIAPGSPAVDAASMAMQLFPFVVDDIHGRLRDKPDIGANEVSSGPAPYGLMGEADVGPMAP